MGVIDGSVMSKIEKFCFPTTYTCSDGMQNSTLNHLKFRLGFFEVLSFRKMTHKKQTSFSSPSKESTTTIK